ncbi:hypothetical protein CEXT_187541 [Caerostris extrusa]|uniref:Uncharacterized protein n=1 Tax=Caerostris extrusa TaxID=172846 RepID=A0AAV4WUZ9_CAEEX|nr:hypothetical protein CEXT_187541 [Caerostris extrusa]
MLSTDFISQRRLVSHKSTLLISGQDFGIPYFKIKTGLHSAIADSRRDKSPARFIYLFRFQVQLIGLAKIKFICKRGQSNFRSVSVQAQQVRVFVNTHTRGATPKLA